MHLIDAQREMRQAFLGGFMGQLVSGTLWLVSAGLATWGTRRSAILFLVIAGMFIFPLTRLGLWIDAPFATGGWLTGMLLWIFAWLGRRSALAEERAAGRAGALVTGGAT